MLPPLSLALAGVVSGLTWRLPSIGRLDARVMRSINRGAWPAYVDGAFSALRPAGTTPFFIAALVLAGIAHPAWGWGLAVAAIAAEAVSKVLKLAVGRQRPFAAEAGVIVRLPVAPIDPSFPSGDAMRAAFLAGLAVTATPPWFAALCVLASVLVASGRVRSGAHYPLDIWAGFFVGLGAALAWAGAPGL
jgi:membrane-associated phospholipid phosphatase